MFCSNCGKEVTESMKFCTNCGVPISDLIRTPMPSPIPVYTPLQTPAQNQIPTLTPIQLAPAPKKVPIVVIVVSFGILAAIAITTILFLDLFFFRRTAGNDPGSEKPSISQSSSTDKNQDKDIDSGGSENSGTQNSNGTEPIGVTVNGKSVASDDTKFIYTYLEGYGHYFATVFVADGDVVYFTAILPEELCISGAEYSGNLISENDIRFDIMITENGYPDYYSTINDPQAFGDLKISIISIDLYQSAEFKISGSITSDKWNARIQADGQSEYTVSTSGY